MPTGICEGVVYGLNAFLPTVDVVCQMNYGFSRQWLDRIRRKRVRQCKLFARLQVIAFPY